MSKKHDFKVGDKVMYVGPHHPALEYGVEYKVSWVHMTGTRVEIKDGCGLFEIVSAAHIHLLHPTKPTSEPATPTPTFKVGDKVVWLGWNDGDPEEPDLTIGKCYRIDQVDSEYQEAWIVDNICDRRVVPFGRLALADEPAPTNTKTISATVIYYPQTGRYTVYGTNEEEATSLVIADLIHDIEGHGPYQMFKLTAEVELPSAKVFPAVLAPFEGENYD